MGATAALEAGELDTAPMGSSTALERNLSACRSVGNDVTLAPPMQLVDARARGVELTTQPT